MSTLRRERAYDINSTAFGAIRGFGSRFEVKLKPRNFRSHGHAAALFCWFTLSLPLVVHESRCLLTAPIPLLAEDRLGLRPLPDQYARC